MSHPVQTMPQPTPVVDFHVHALHAEVFKQSTHKTVFTGFGANPVSEPRPGAKALLDRMFQPESIIEDMTARGIPVRSSHLQHGLTRHLVGGC